MSRAPLLLLLLLMVSSLATLASAQQQYKSSSSSSPAVRTPYSCFYDECPASSSTLPDKAQFEACLRAAFPKDAATKVILPGSPDFKQASIMVAPNFERIPAAVVYAHSTPDVQAAVKCAYINGVRLSAAGGRHSYGGWSVVDNYLVVDMSNMTEARVTGRQGNVLTVQVGPGNTNSLLISQLHKAGYSTAGTIIGQCPSVGVSGYILGGGQGDLSRMFGLACDQLIGLEMVDFKGNVVTANSTHNSDLMWASCGGGGGLGVVTRWTLRAHDLGKEPFSRITIAYNKKSAIPAMLRAQEFIMDPRTDLRFSGGGGSLAGQNLYFAGPLSTAIRLLKEGGLLNPDWMEHAQPSIAIQSRAHLNQPHLKLDVSSIPGMPSDGVIGFTFANYYEAIMNSECEWFAQKSPPAALGMYVKEATKYGFGPDKSCLDTAVLNRFKAIALQPGSVITSGRSYMWRAYGFLRACRQLPPLSAAAWEALQAVTEDPRCAGKGTGDVPELSRQLQADADTFYYCYALKHLVNKPGWNHLLGGAVAKVPQNATAFPWRHTISPLCVDAGFPQDALEADGSLKTSYAFDMPGTRSPVLSLPALAKGVEAVQAAYLKALYTVLGQEVAMRAYFNYQTTQVDDYTEAYWGPNYKRLQQIKAKWDPEGFFSKPFTVQPAKA